MNLISPTQWTATVLGADSQQLPPQILAQIGYVSESQVLPARLSVGEYIEYLRPFYPSWDRELESSIRSRMQLPPERRIGQLSHGMRLALGLTCALPYRPKLLILDEPFSGLDPLVREELMEGLLPLIGDLTLFIASQELDEIESVATHIGFLHAGNMLLEEPLDELSARLREVRVTLEKPAVVPASMPKEWLQARAFGNVLTFVDSRFSEDNLEERLRGLLGPVRQIDTQTLPLNSVFKTLARAARAGAVP